MPAVILIRAIVRCPLIVSTILPLAYHVSCFFYYKVQLILTTYAHLHFYDVHMQTLFL